MKVFASYNIKGGVGKTATAVNLAYLAARDGYRVLLWDLDPQAAASFLFRIRPRVKGGGKALIQGTRSIDGAIKATDFDNLDLLPADFTYRNLDLILDNAKNPTRKLRRLLTPLRAEYDVIFLDCPPSISLLSESVLHAADVLLVPLIPTTLSVRTLDQLTEFISGFNGHQPGVLAFFSMIDRRKRLHLEIAEQLPAAAIRLRGDRHPGAVDDRADVGAPRPGHRVRAAQRRGAQLRRAVGRGQGAQRAARTARPRRSAETGHETDHRLGSPRPAVPAGSSARSRAAAPARPAAARSRAVSAASAGPRRNLTTRSRSPAR